MADNTNRNVIKKPTREIIQAFDMLTARYRVVPAYKVYAIWRGRAMPATEEGNCAESDRDFDCAYRIHFNSRSADERLEPTGRLPGSPEHVE